MNISGKFVGVQRLGWNMIKWVLEGFAFWDGSAVDLHLATLRG
jgi:hypothetical protein